MDIQDALTAKSLLKITVVDDDVFLLKLMQRMLTLQGYATVNCYESGAHALAGIDKDAPELIFLDLNMPDMDGIEFVRHLVQRSFDGSLIVVSGEDTRMLQAAEKLVKAHQINILGVLQKPVVPEALSALLTQWKPADAEKARAASKIYSIEQLREALDRGELINYYQPKVAVESGRVVGVETLVRWQHPLDGLVMPDSFISLAEDSGLIDQLAERVLQLALQQTISWEQQGVHLPLAINISMENLASLDFVDLLTARMADAGVLPSDITLEITESRGMRDPAIMLDTLTRLRLKRFVLSMDDFGTGYSTLAQLRDIPFEEFKIDRSFVHKAWVDQRIRAMFDTSLSLAKQLGMTVVAEGVENVNDWDFLRKTTCDYAQGYFIAKPMPGDDLPAWIQAWEKRVRADLIPDQEPAAVTTPQTKLAGMTVLIIEDHEFQRRVQSKILREENFNVVLAANGTEALNVLRKLRPDLMLIDVELPDFSGLEILRRLRSTAIFKRTPVLMVSGNNTKEVLEESRKNGANGFLAKPFDRKTLVEKIGRIVNA